MTRLLTNIRTLLLAVLFGMLAIGCASAQAAAFADVLTTPASASARAERALINDLARAGKRLVGVGQRGHIIFSDDNGAHWAQAKVPVSADLVAVQFTSSVEGWAVGHDGVVLHSADAGASWELQLDGRRAAALIATYYKDAAEPLRGQAVRMAEQGPDKPFLDLWFEDALHGFVVGAFNMIFETRDGGRTWQPWLERTANPRGFHLNAIGAIGEDIVIVGEQGLVMKMKKGGQGFSAIETPYRGSFFGLAGGSGGLVVFGLRGNALHSSDAGRSWKKVDTGVPVGLVAAITLPDARIAMVSLAGHVLLSSDGGLSFTRLLGTTAGPVSALVATDNGALVLGGQRGVRLQSLQTK
jgi:photosystem II stability/assembly factor-like uncharacterized protein